MGQLVAFMELTYFSQLLIIKISIVLERSLSLKLSHTVNKVNSFEGNLQSSLFLQPVSPLGKTSMPLFQSWGKQRLTSLRMSPLIYIQCVGQQWQLLVFLVCISCRAWNLYPTNELALGQLGPLLLLFYFIEIEPLQVGAGQGKRTPDLHLSGIWVLQHRAGGERSAAGLPLSERYCHPESISRFPYYYAELPETG